jgi:hypothetical protein
VGREESLEQAVERGERRVRDHCEGAAGESEVGGVRPYDGDVVLPVSVSQGGGAGGVQLDGDHPCLGAQECVGQYAGSSTDVDDQVSLFHCGPVDEATGPAVIEAMPPPWWPRSSGHGASS